MEDLLGSMDYRMRTREAPTTARTNCNFPNNNKEYCICTNEFVGECNLLMHPNTYIKRGECIS